MIGNVVILLWYVVVWRRWWGNVVVRWQVGVEVLLPLIRRLFLSLLLLAEDTNSILQLC
jgi:hypothetical protein